VQFKMNLLNLTMVM